MYFMLSGMQIQPSKFDEHYKNVHSSLETRNNKEILKVKAARFDCQGTLPNQGFTLIRKLLLDASYKDAYQVAKKKNDTYNHQKNYALKVVKIILGKDTERMVAQVPINNNLIKNRIDMSHDILEQVIDDIKASSMKILLQLNKYMDVAHCS